MNVLEIAVRNYFANTEGMSAEELEPHLNSPEAGAFFDLTANFIAGPYGCLALAGSEPIKDDMGYVQALAETIIEINNTTIVVPSLEIAEAVHTVLEDLKGRIEARIEEVTRPEPTEVSFIDLFEQIFGVRLEPATR